MASPKAATLRGCGGGLHQRWLLHHRTDLTATAEDDCGNIGTASGVQIIQVADGIAPAITLSNVQESVACDMWSCDLDMLVDLGFVSWNDNCGIDTAFVSCAPASGGCVDLAPTWDLEYTVIDACGNTSTASQFILMVDTVAPTIDIVPADVVLELDADCMGELDPSQSGEVSITSTDNCDASPTLSYTIEDSAPEYTCAEGVERTSSHAPSTRCPRTTAATRPRTAAPRC